MGLPDFKKYYFASHITRIIDWHCHADLKVWVSLEEEMSPIEIFPMATGIQTPHTEPKPTPPDKYHLVNFPPLD